MVNRLRLGMVATLALAGVACSHDSMAPHRAASVALVPGVALSATVGTALSASPTFVVRDETGAELSDAAVSITVTAGGGTLAGAPTRTRSGGTPVGVWTLGTTAGANVITVNVSGAIPLLVQATATPDSPSQLVVASGNGQSASANAQFANPVVIKVSDRYGNGVAGVGVSFAVTKGGGVLSGGTKAVSDATGAAQAPAWTLGRTAAAQQLVATAGSLNTAVNATVATKFNPEVRFFGPDVSPAIRQSFGRAIERVQALVVGDVPDVAISSFDVASLCGTAGVPAMNETIDDLVIYATVAPIDGKGGVLGAAGPCLIRSAAQGRFPLVGVMRFDVADLEALAADGRLDDVILHEMLHVLGFGTLWQLKGLGANLGTLNTSFIGSQAVQGCVSSGGPRLCAASVPVENSGGSGTADTHWRESTMSAELMTGYISPQGVSNPLSLITIGSLADLGYVVNTSVNDPFSLGSAGSRQIETIRSVGHGGSEAYAETVLMPVLEQVAAGRTLSISPSR